MNVAVIAAGGVGERTGLAGGKQLALLSGRPVLSHTLSAFVACPAIDSIVVVISGLRLDDALQTVSELGHEKVSSVVEGGRTRQESVAAGLAEVPAEAALIAVHDGARPLVTPTLIAEVITALEADRQLAGLVVGHPSYDTLKRVDDGHRVIETPDRSSLWAAQTPQVFRASVLREAYSAAERAGFAGTDDASLVERIGGPVGMFPGPRDNMKITVPEDLLVMERLLALRAEGEQ